MVLVWDAFLRRPCVGVGLINLPGQKRETTRNCEGKYDVRDEQWWNLLGILLCVCLHPVYSYSRSQTLTRTDKLTHMSMYIGNHLQCAFRIRSANTLRNWPAFSKYAQWSIQNTHSTDLRVHLLYIMHIRSSFVHTYNIQHTACTHKIRQHSVLTSHVPPQFPVSTLGG